MNKRKGYKKILIIQYIGDLRRKNLRINIIRTKMQCVPIKT